MGAALGPETRSPITALNQASRSGPNSRRATLRSSLGFYFSDSSPSLAYGCLFRPTTVRRFSPAGQLHTYVCNQLRLRPPSRCRDRYIRVGRNPIGSSTFERLARPHWPADLLPLIGAIGYYLPMSPDITYRTVASERGPLRSW